jgi:hypothetical protein
MAIIAELAIIVSQRFYIFDTYESLKVKNNILDEIYIEINLMTEIHFSAGMMKQALMGKFDISDPNFTKSKLYFEQTKTFIQ